MSDSARYTWWPAFSADTSDIADVRSVPMHVLAMAAITTILCLPVVTAATGIAATTIVILIGTHLAWYLAGPFVLLRRPANRLRSNVVMAGNLLVNTAIAVAIPISAREITTPLWMLAVLYACVNGSMQHRERSLAFLLVHGLSPLVGLVVPQRDHTTDWDIAAPVLCAVLCVAGYNHLSRVSARWRQLRTEQEAALAVLRARRAARDREDLLGDLRDSVGSTLAVVGTYADALEQYVDRPADLRELAAIVRDAARDGLGDLRALIGAMVPAAGTIEGLAVRLQQVGAAAADASAPEITVTVREGAAVPLDAAARIVMVRAFQDALRAARRGDARHLSACVGSTAGTVTFELTDDASAANVDPAIDGRMAQRVAELGGTYARSPLATRGSIVRIELVRAR